MSLIPGQGSVLTGWCCCQAGQEKANWTLGCAQSLPSSNTAILLCQERQTSPRTAPGSLQSWKSYLMRLHHFKECVEVFRGKKYGLFLLFERRWQANLLFSVLQQSPQTKLKSILLCTGTISTQNNNQVSIWLPAEKNIKLHITAIYKIHSMLEIQLLSPCIWMCNCHNESHLKTVSPTACMPKVTLKSLCLNSCCHRNKLAERISVYWSCDHATERQQRLSFNINLYCQEELWYQGFWSQMLPEKILGRHEIITLADQ